MAQRTQIPSTMTDMFRHAQEIIALNPVIGPQLVHFWRAQDAVLDETETFARHWFARRHKAAQTALAAAQEVTQNGATDPAGAMRAITEWQTRSMERIAEDMQEWVDTCSRCAGHMTREESEASRDTLKKASKTSSATGTAKKESVPV
ncbi:hypothetical protein [Roseovarius salis]|uniref:hypothetical protein n=1 Tax=Roseovarius salis TaxID=3376063 RepID=UPI0037CAF6B6